MIGPNEVAASAARTTTGTSGNMRLNRHNGAVNGQHRLTLGVNITAASGTTPTLDLTVEWSFDGGTTFLVGDPADSFTQKTTTGTAAKAFEAKGDCYRVRWTIAGTTPSFTFSVREVQH